MKVYVFSIVDFTVVHSIRAESSTYENMLDAKLAKSDSDLGRGPKKIDFFLGKSPKLWVGGGLES